MAAATVEASRIPSTKYMNEKITELDKSRNPLEIRKVRIPNHNCEVIISHTGPESWFMHEIDTSADGLHCYTTDRSLHIAAIAGYDLSRRKVYPEHIKGLLGGAVQVARFAGWTGNGIVLENIPVTKSTTSKWGKITFEPETVESRFSHFRTTTQRLVDAKCIHTKTRLTTEENDMFRAPVVWDPVESVSKVEFEPETELPETRWRTFVHSYAGMVMISLKEAEERAKSFFVNKDGTVGYRPEANEESEDDEDENEDDEDEKKDEKKDEHDDNN